MLALPTVGMARSVNKHNVDFAALCDWIEGNTLFDDERLSASDVMDVLIENEIYDSQEFAWQIVSSAWAELNRRLSWVGIGSPIEVKKSSLRRVRDWRDASAHSFCLALSFVQWYPAWSDEFGNDYNEQGELFEQLTKEAMEKLFPEWVIHPTGWTRTRQSKIREVIKDLAERLGEAQGNVEWWIDENAHEAGLDLLCYRPFGDGRVGQPVLLMQCASGVNWKSKRKTPDLDLWQKIVVFTAAPKKAFAMPYALTDKDFSRSCSLVNGLFLDRYRLLMPGRTNPDWVSAELKATITKWLEPRIENLPRDGD